MQKYMFGINERFFYAFSVWQSDLKLTQSHFMKGLSLREKSTHDTVGHSLLGHEMVSPTCEAVKSEKLTFMKTNKPL